MTYSNRSDLFDLACKELNGIASIANAMRDGHTHTEHRVSRAIVVTGLVAVALTVALPIVVPWFQAEDIGAAAVAWLVSARLFFPASLAAGLLAGVVTYLWTPPSSALVERLDRLLAEYEPSDRQAYADLQAAVRRERAFDPQAVLAWSRVELKALKRVFGVGLPDESQFLARSTLPGTVTEWSSDPKQETGA